MIGYKDFLKIPCPKCERKGLHYPERNAWGWKSFDVSECRFCYARFPIEEIKKLVEALDEN